MLQVNPRHLITTNGYESLQFGHPPLSTSTPTRYSRFTPPQPQEHYGFMTATANAFCHMNTSSSPNGPALTPTPISPIIDYSSSPPITNGSPITNVSCRYVQQHHQPAAAASPSSCCTFTPVNTTPVSPIAGDSPLRYSPCTGYPENSPAHPYNHARLLQSRQFCPAGSPAAAFPVANVPAAGSQSHVVQPEVVMVPPRCRRQLHFRSASTPDAPPPMTSFDESSLVFDDSGFDGLFTNVSGNSVDLGENVENDEEFLMDDETSFGERVTTTSMLHYNRLF